MFFDGQFIKCVGIDEDEEVGAAEGVLTYEYDADASMSFSDVTSGV